MQIILSLVAVLILAAGIVVNQNTDLFKPNASEKSRDNVLAQQDTPQNEEGKAEVVSEQANEINVENSQAVAGPTSTPYIKPQVDDLGKYRYPGATVIVSSSTTLVLESSENPDPITDWYKEVINSDGLNVTSFVVTKTNDNVLNKLVGADGVREIKVEIKKDSGDSMVKIEVAVD